jgi:hypothetical protein
MQAIWSRLISSEGRGRADRNWLKMAVLAAALIVLAAIAYRFVAPLTSWRHAAEQAVSPAQRVALEQCTEAAYMFHDVRWAAACMDVAERDEALHAACMNDADVMGDPQLGQSYCDTMFGLSDGSAECTLPDARAAPLDALLMDAEQTCRAEARVQSRVSRRAD